MIAIGHHIGEKDQVRNLETSIFYEYHAARATAEKLKEEKFPETKQSGNIPMVYKVPTSPTGPTDAGTSVSLNNNVIYPGSSHHQRCYSVRPCQK